MDDLDKLKNEFKGYLSTFKRVSKDTTKKEYLCHSNREIYNFDKYVGQEYKSFDALWVDNGKIYCIEFKNQPLDNIKDKKIQGKFKEGFGVLAKTFDKLEIRKDVHKIYFCVVFKDSNNKNIDDFSATMDELQIEFNIKFGLEQFGASGFNPEIVTAPKSYFMEKFNHYFAIVQ